MKVFIRIGDRDTDFSILGVYANYETAEAASELKRVPGEYIEEYDVEQIP